MDKPVFLKPQLKHTQDPQVLFIICISDKLPGDNNADAQPLYNTSSLKN